MDVHSEQALPVDGLIAKRTMTDRSAGLFLDIGGFPGDELDIRIKPIDETGDGDVPFVGSGFVGSLCPQFGKLGVPEDKADGIARQMKQKVVELADVLEPLTQALGKIRDPAPEQHGYGFGSGDDLTDDLLRR